MLFLASLLIYPYFVDITNIYNWIWFIFIFALTIVIWYFCCDITWKDAILAAFWCIASTYGIISIYCHFLSGSYS